MDAGYLQRSNREHFTRLNTAGRTLTREEITLAWLKVGWKPERTNEKSAGECFLELRHDLAEQGLTLELDALVSATSFLWSVSHNDGRLLANSDLLKGDVIRPMASALSQRWMPVQDALNAGAKILAQCGLDYGPRGHFSSLYELAVLCAWLYVAEIWKTDHTLSELERDDFDKRCAQTAAKYLDRWIMCSLWAEVWSGSSTTQIEAYAKALAELLKSIENCHDLSTAHKTWEECFAGFVEALTPAASNYIATISATGRDRVAIYRNPLWIWHRLDSDRWEKSQVQLRVGKKKATCEVDHVVSFSLWKTKLSSSPSNEATEDEDAIALANKLGNSALLEKNFNISKGNKTLKSFLSQIHEVLTKKVRIDAWCAALAIPQPLLDPANATIDQVTESVENRDKEIRADLTEFVRGEQHRVDIETPALAMNAKTPSADHEMSQSTPDSLDDDAYEANTQSASEMAHEDRETEPSNLPVTPRPGTDLPALRSAYQEDESLKLILDHFAARQRNQNITEVDALVSALHRSGISLDRYAVVRAFRCLDALGIGRFITGRKGHATRFEWHEKSMSIRALATEEKST
jgi:hypothetical protein